MGVTTGLALRTMAIVLADSQVIRLRQIAADRSSGVTRVSVSSVARDMIEHGLQEVVLLQNANISNSDASRATEAAS